FEGLEAASDTPEVTSDAASDAAVEGQIDAAPDEASETPAPYTLAGVGEKTVRKLAEGGFATLEALAAATAEQLSEVPGIGEKKAEKILAAARGEAPAEDTQQE